ncbi:hypothetical protein CUMW_205290 [Citrus unshiu]|uniref:Cytochrome b561 and DOMON domain-containing protein n=1 Tax=Citrus unshiu TaxID=55188 RepID=A0A2H5Q875_CITUN|nr:hypothetical protein CUMW_205290 [Citrus unshiu]
MKRIFLIALFTLLLSPSSSFAQTTQTCTNYRFTTHNNKYGACVDLQALNSFLHWSYDEATGSVDLAYRHVGMKPTRWVAWAINPTGKGMVGSQSLVAYRNPNGILKAYTSPVMSYGTNLQEGNLSFKVPKISADFSNNEMIIYATIVLPKNMTTVSHVWQEGPVRGDNHLGMHPLGGDNVKSMGTLDLLSGKVTTTKGGTSGTLGLLDASGCYYCQVFQSADPAWFYAHIICQSSAYLLGIAGAGTGIYLGNKSHGIQHSTHRTIGILLLVLGFIQVLALKLRPKKEHKYRIWWNFYHHSVGYAIIILSIFNIFEGFNILNPLKIWRLVYACVLIVLGAIAVILEVAARKMENPETKSEQQHEV